MTRSARSAVRASLAPVLAPVLAAVLVLAAPALSSNAAAAHGAVPSSRHAAAKAALDRVIAAFRVKQADRTTPRTTPLPYRDVTLLLRDLRTALPALSPTERATAQTYLARSAAGISSACTGSVIQTAHFCVHYSTGILNPNAATQQQAQLTADTFEYVYSKEVTGLGYRAPLNDGDGLLDVYLQELGNQRIYGYCDTGGNSPDGYTSPAYCAVDNDFSTNEYGAPPLNSLRVTAAHEFFHAVQFAYNATQNSWFMEGTAVWMEDIVYPTINDYLQYLPLSQVVHPLQPADYEGDLERYGTVVFWKFLSERFKDNNIIRQVWNAAVPSTHRDGIHAAAAVVAARGYSWPAEFARYGIWNTLPPGSYGDRSLWPSPGAWRSKTMTPSSHNTGLLSVSLNHLSHAPLVLRPSGIPTRSKLRVAVDAPSTSHGSRASLEVRFTNGTVKNYAISLDSQGNGVIRVGFNPRYVKSAIVILTNSSAGYNAQPFKVDAKTVA